MDQTPIKYRIILEYLGTRYAGWQIQPGQRTIQREVTLALSQISGQESNVVGSGRTDSGVHAVGQVAHFVLPKPLQPSRIQRAFNGILPPDIRVRHVRRVPLEFHAQKSALGKRYRYSIYNGAVLSPFLDGLVHQIRPKLNRQAMSEAARHLVGKHDFSGFAAAGSERKSNVRRVTAVRWSRKGAYLNFFIEGNGFLHHMVRNVVGTLIQVGLSKRPPGDVRRVLDSRNRRNAGPTAPARGLYLVRVFY